LGTYSTTWVHIARNNHTDRCIDIQTKCDLLKSKLHLAQIRLPLLTWPAYYKTHMQIPQNIRTGDRLIPGGYKKFTVPVCSRYMRMIMNHCEIIRHPWLRDGAFATSLRIIWLSEPQKDWIRTVLARCEAATCVWEINDSLFWRKCFLLLLYINILLLSWGGG